MPTIFDTKGDAIEKKHVFIKNSGWVKAYDSIDHKDGETIYKGLRHYPPHRVKTIHGNVDYESAHGRV